MKSPDLAVIDGDVPLSDEPNQTERHERLVRLWLHKNNAKILTSADSILWRNDSFTPEELADFIWRDFPKSSPRMIKITLKTIILAQRDAVLARVRRAILDVPQTDDKELRAWLRLIVHPETTAQRLEYYVVAFRQLIWQIKRKLRGRPTKYEIMPIFYSGQETGKSTTIRQFGTALGELFMGDASFALLTDNFRIRQLARVYLVFFDEMEKAERTDVNNIKRIITSPEAQGRGMRSESERKVYKNASFIGATNTPVNEQIIDTTGMRRFVEIRCTDVKYTPAVGEALAKVDMAAVWACETGESNECPYGENRELMYAFQDELRTKSDLELFIDDYLVPSDNTLDTLQNTVLYGQYSRFCELQKHKPCSIQVFARTLKLKFKHTTRQHACVFTGIKSLFDG